MNPIERLRDQIQQDHPRALVELIPPINAGGVWSLDIDLADKKLALEWSEETGFGISSISPDNFGERPDEAFASVSLARRRINELLTSGKRTVPPYGISSSRLRERRGITQQALARRLGVRQASISGMENRDDIQLSTLRRYIEALEGTLKIFGIFPEAQYQVELHGSYIGEQPEENSEEELSIVGHCRYVAYEAAFPRLYAAGQLGQATKRAGDIKAKCAVIEMPA